MKTTTQYAIRLYREGGTPEKSEGGDRYLNFAPTACFQTINALEDATLFGSVNDICANSTAVEFLKCPSVGARIERIEVTENPGVTREIADLTDPRPAVGYANAFKGLRSIGVWRTRGWNGYTPDLTDTDAVFPTLLALAAEHLKNAETPAGLEFVKIVETEGEPTVTRRSLGVVE